MRCRHLLAAFFCLALLASVPASGLTLPGAVDPSLAAAAARMKTRDYAGARDAAAQLPPGGARDLLLGMAAARTGESETAVAVLARAADTFPLLADYALLTEAQSLHRLGRFSEALPVLEKLLREYPESPVNRTALLLVANTLADKGDFTAAIKAYQRFIERYPAGSDALTALFRTAQCRDLAGETGSAVTSLRSIWLNNPGSPLAAKAEEELRTIAARGVKVPAYTAEELLRRAQNLYNLKKYSQAVAAFRAVPLEGQGEEFSARVVLKTGQALYRARQGREAEKLFSGLVTSPRKGIAAEAAYWLAKSQDRDGREDAAVATYLGFVQTAPTAELADDALLEAAYIRKQQKKGAEALTLLKLLMANYPGSNLKLTALWEVAWLSYRNGDLATAAEQFRKLAENDVYREKALYWQAQVLAAAGDGVGATTTLDALLREYPFGFYALSCRKGRAVDAPALPVPTDPTAGLPLPEGYERIKALIALGLTDEARKELAVARRRNASPKTLQALSRLYLELEDYHGALALLTREKPRLVANDPAFAWGASYPLPYRETVRQQAAASGVAENLIYAVIRAESSFSPTALSPAGAVGLMQLMPATAATILGVRDGSAGDRLTRPEVNIGLGVRHLKDLLALYDGDLVAAVAAYNAGAGNVNRWKKRFGQLPADQFIESIPFGETREYVKKVLA
ncbi:MAG TPA: transglycosylase SLT domain-containing protein, partial [Geobacteraceae bacterium]